MIGNYHVCVREELFKKLFLFATSLVNVTTTIFIKEYLKIYLLFFILVFIIIAIPYFIVNNGRAEPILFFKNRKKIIFSFIIIINFIFPPDIFIQVFSIFFIYASFEICLIFICYKIAIKNILNILLIRFYYKGIIG